MTELVHQKITKLIGGTVFVSISRDVGDGTIRHSVAYENRYGGQSWVSCHRFSDVDQANAAALVLGDYLGATVR